GREREPVVVEHVAGPAQPFARLRTLAVGEGLLEERPGLLPVPGCESRPTFVESSRRFGPLLHGRTLTPASDNRQLRRDRLPGSGTALASSSVAARAPRERRAQASILTACCARRQVPRISPAAARAPDHT